MARVTKIDSNLVGNSFAIEEQPGVLPQNPTWYPLQINSYNDYGTEIETIARNPISAGRQRTKGVVNDQNTTAGMSLDFLQHGLEQVMEAAFFADIRARGRIEASSTLRVTASASTKVLGYTGSLSGFGPGSMVNVKGFTNPSNNGLKTVVSVRAGTGITINEDLIDETSEKASICLAGITAAAGDLSVEVQADGTPTMKLAKNDFRVLNFEPGEWICVGGDADENAFVNPVNNGFKRIRAIQGNTLFFDKYDAPMVNENGSGKSVQVFLGNRLRNEVGDLIKQKTIQFERLLGAPETTRPKDYQSEYVLGAMINEFNIDFPLAGLMKVDINSIGNTSELRSIDDGIKPGLRPPLQDSHAFNCSSDFQRLRMMVLKNGIPSIDLVGYLTELKINVNNNVTPNKALNVLGAFSSTLGSFDVTGTANAYFVTIDAQKAIRDNADVTLDVIIAKENSGMVFDIPLMSVGGGKPDLSSPAIMLPLTFDGANANKLDTSMDYTMLIQIFPYLPDRVAAGGGVV